MKTSQDPRHLARRVALQILFAWESNCKLNQSVRQEKELYQKARQLYRQWTLSPNGDEQPFDRALTQEIVKRVVKKHIEFDQLIGKAAPEWPLPQIAPIDLSILRIAVAELTQKGDLPYKVVIDEAVELAKEFGGENSSRFINGVLGTVVGELGMG